MRANDRVRELGARREWLAARGGAPHARARGGQECAGRASFCPPPSPPNDLAPRNGLLPAGRASLAQHREPSRFPDARGGGGAAAAAAAGARARARARGSSGSCSGCGGR